VLVETDWVADCAAVFFDLTTWWVACAARRKRRKQLRPGRGHFPPERRRKRPANLKIDLLRKTGRGVSPFSGPGRCAWAVV